MGDAPERVSAVSTMVSAGVDISTMATLEYSGGRRAQLSCAMDTAYQRHAIIAGSGGVIETEYLNHTSTAPNGDAYGYLPSVLRVRKGTAGILPLVREASGTSSDTGSGFRFSAEAFAKVVREGDYAAAERAAQASIDIAATLDAIRRSAQSGAPVTL